MNIFSINPNKPRQNGFVSIIAVMALVLIVLIVLQQNLRISASKALTGLQHSDSVAALALAQSGTEITVQKLANAARSTPNLAAICVASNLGLTTESAALNSGSGSFSLAGALLSTKGYCKIRVTGTLRAASRTIETWVNLAPVYGTAGFGSSPTLTLSNTLDVKAIGVFNLGWGTNYSLGHNVSGTGNATCTNCLSTVWNGAVPGSANNIGGSGNYSQAMAPGGSASSTHTLSDARNYVMVGQILGGTASQEPTVLSNGTQITGVNNNNDTTLITSATTSNVNSADICNGNATANAMVIGVSAVGPSPINGQPNLTGHFNSATFNYAGSAGPGVTVASTPSASKNYNHYPDANANLGLSTPIAWGDVFVELYYFFQNPVTLNVLSATSGSNTFTVNGTYSVNQLKGLYLQPKNNVIDNDTYITGNTSNTLTLNRNLSGNISNGTPVCSGLCGFIPSSKTNMSFTFGKADTSIAAKAWIAGMLCLKGVDDNKVLAISQNSGISVLLWHEVLSNDPALF